jgi:hypothetical protein
MAGDSWKERVALQKKRIRKDGGSLVFLRDQWPWRFKVQRGLPARTGLELVGRECGRCQNMSKHWPPNGCTCSYREVSLEADSDFWTSGELTLEELERVQVPAK